jgi:hypothetical protein
VISYFIMSNEKVNLFCRIADHPPHYSHSHTPLPSLSISKNIVNLNHPRLVPLVEVRNNVVDVLLFEVRAEVAWQ